MIVGEPRTTAEGDEAAVNRDDLVKPSRAESARAIGAASPAEWIPSPRCWRVAAAEPLRSFAIPGSLTIKAVVGKADRVRSWLAAMTGLPKAHGGRRATIRA